MNDELKTTGKVADAVKEVAASSGKALDAASGIGQFFNDVFGDIVIDGFGLVRDRLKFFRFERAALLAQKTEQRLAQKGITVVRPVPPKIALPLIENASLEEDEDLHSLWANLLASALDRSSDPIERKYVSILAELSSEDAWVLDTIYADWRKSPHRKPFSEGTLEYGECVDGTASHDATAVILLSKLGLIAPSFIKFKTYQPGGHNRYGDYGPFSDEVQVYGDLQAVVVTTLGERFCKAVIETDDVD